MQFAFVFDHQSSTYRIHLTSLFDASSQQQPTSFIWSPDELQTLETFFNDTFFPFSSSSNQITMQSLDLLSLGTIPNRTTAMGAVEKMLAIIHPRILRDLVKVIRLEQVSSSFDETHRQADIIDVFSLRRILKAIISGVYAGVLPFRKASVSLKLVIHPSSFRPLDPQSLR